MIIKSSKAKKIKPRLVKKLPALKLVNVKTLMKIIVLDSSKDILRRESRGKRLILLRRHPKENPFLKLFLTDYFKLRYRYQRLEKHYCILGQRNVKQR